MLSGTTPRGILQNEGVTNKYTYMDATLRTSVDLLFKASIWESAQIHSSYIPHSLLGQYVRNPEFLYQ